MYLSATCTDNSFDLQTPLVLQGELLQARPSSGPGPCTSQSRMPAQEDIHAKLQNGQDFGQERLAYVADTWKGRLDPAEHLTPGRHGEWTTVSGLGVPLGPRWGVTSTPPGIDANDSRAKEIMRRQQLR